MIRGFAVLLFLLGGCAWADRLHERNLRFGLTKLDSSSGLRFDAASSIIRVITLLEEMDLETRDRFQIDLRKGEGHLLRIFRRLSSDGNSLKAGKVLPILRELSLSDLSKTDPSEIEELYYALRKADASLSESFAGIERKARAVDAQVIERTREAELEMALILFRAAERDIGKGPIELTGKLWFGLNELSGNKLSSVLNPYVLLPRVKYADQFGKVRLNAFRGKGSSFNWREMRNYLFYSVGLSK